MYKSICIFVVVLCLPWVTHGQSSPDPAKTMKAYHVGDLVSKSAFGISSFGKTTSADWNAEYPETRKALVELQELVEALCCESPASVKVYSPSLTLIVRHTAEGHEEVRQLLQALRHEDPVELRLECRALYSNADELLKYQREESEQARLEILLHQRKFAKDEAAELIQFLPHGPLISHTVVLKNGRRTSWGDIGRPCTAMGRVDPVKSIAQIRLDFIADDFADLTPFGSQSLTLADGESALFNHYCDGGTVVWLVTASLGADETTEVTTK